MFQKLLFFILFLNASWSGLAQITNEPELPVANGKVVITFDSSKDSRLGYFTGDLYAHTGVTIEGKGRWQNVIESWGDNATQPKLTNKGNGIYELEISPDINTFYSVAAGDKVTEMCFVFRSADASKQTNDLFVTVYDEGLVVNITQPSGSILEKDKQISISAVSSMNADLKLYLDDTLLSSATGTQINTNHTFTEGGNYWLIAEATANGETAFDSMKIFIRGEIVTEPKPTAYRNGINYPSDASAALVLWAPYKNFVYVIGDFNNWELSNEYLMKKNGDYFWLEIPNLEKGKEYAFQYFIDGNLKIADPYTEKVLDPWNDQYIDGTTYPNLKAYPEGKTRGIVSVLQPGQDKYQWEISDFQAPVKEKMVIYELLIRDFTSEHSYASVISQLDYLQDLRVNVLELMPVNEFEGNNSWGYNPSFYFAPDKYYGPKNELKRLVDECHKRGIAVVIDMVLNHSYGQSPFVQMYWDSDLNRPAADNPWYNETSPNTVYSWGYDFNHESAATKQLVDSINSFWINEYKVDGFRFDFTKGFTNTPGDGSAYDMSRISILERMADEIRDRNPDALVILEHLTGNTEETVLANYGMFLWGNLNYAYGETSMGWGSSLNSGIYSSRGWNEPNLVTYMESHDEERLVYKCVNYGNASGNYSTKELSTALDRIELNSVFFLPLPGPKMIWQFGELGYDYSINTCEDGTTINDGCRTAMKPIRWDYTNNTNRTDLFRVMAKLNELKQTYEEFSVGTFDFDLSGNTKWYTFSNNQNYVLAVGNFDVQAANPTVSFPTNGKWYEFFSRDSIDITSANQAVQLQPGEYRLYSTRKFAEPHVITDIAEPTLQNKGLQVFPNPANEHLTIFSDKTIQGLELYSLQGKQIFQILNIGQKETQLNLKEMVPGIYILRTVFSDGVVTQKVVKE